MSRCQTCGQFVKAEESFCRRDKPVTYTPLTSRTSTVSYELAAFDKAAEQLGNVKTAARSHRRKSWFRRGRKA